MKFFLIFLLAGYFVVSPHMATARDEVLNFSIADAMKTDDFSKLVGDRVKFFFGDQAHPAISTKGGVFYTNKKTNAFNKSDLKACQRAFYSALISLRDRAIKERGNAVVNIESNYKNNLYSNDKEFQCGAGNVIAGVALRGQVVNLE